MIPFAARFHISETTSEKEDQVFAVARDAENEILRVVCTELAEEQGFLSGTFIDFVPRLFGLEDAASEAMVAIYEDKVLLERLNSIEGVTVTPVDSPV